MGADAFLGRTLGHYRIVEQIGVGGMGVVYRAYDEKLDRQVALKMMTPGALADETARRRFRQEALAISRLNHPNIATIFDFDTQDGVDFLITELISGGSLADKLAHGPLSEPELLPIAVQIAAALEDAHERNVLHRDLKPGNIMLTAKGHVKLLDFGLAKLLAAPETDDTRSMMTAAGMTAGTVPYMAPEQLRGEALDVRSDIWSFGVIVYEMACGRVPFEGKTGTALAGSILHEQPPRPRELNPAISAKLEAVVLRCLTKDREGRYRSMKEVVAELKRLSGMITVAELAAQAPAQAWKRWRWPAVTAVILVLAGFAWWQWPGRGTPASDSRSIRTVAVLPLENLSGDSAQDYFADGLTEALIADLSRIRDLKIISRTSVMQYKNVRKPLPQIAKELGADGIIEGSVVREGDDVRVTVQMIDGATDQHLWADSYHRSFRGILALQSEIAQAIAQKVQAELTGTERAALSAAAEVDPGAHEAYMLGRHHLRAGDLKDLEAALEQFQKAVTRQPGHALSYVGLAETYASLSNEYHAPHDMMPKAKAFAQRALELDPNLAEAHVLIAVVQLRYEWDFTAAGASFRRAIELRPSLSDAHAQFGEYLAIIGQHDQSLEETRMAEQLDPLNRFGFYNLFVARRYPEAVESCRKTLELYPDRAYPHAVMGLAFSHQGKAAEAVAAADKTVAATKAPIPRAIAAEVYADNGQQAKARQLAQELVAEAGRGYVCAYSVAKVFLALGEKERAFEWLEKGYRDRTH